jgi:hypothetical protein
MPLWLLAVLAAGVMTGSWLRWRTREINARALEGQRALHSGDFERAETIFTEMMQARSTRALGRELLAWTRTRQERLQDAIDLHLDDKKRGWSSMLELARLYALRGDVEPAMRFAGDARREVARERRMNRETGDARLLFIDALIATRRSDFTSASNTLSQQWAAFEQSHGGWLAEACLLRGFLAAQLGATPEIWLGLGDTARARVRWMSSEWPELRAFIDAHEPTT